MKYNIVTLNNDIDYTGRNIVCGVKDFGLYKPSEYWISANAEADKTEGKRMCSSQEVIDLIDSVPSDSIFMQEGFIPTCKQKDEKCDEKDYDFINIKYHGGE